MDFLSYYVHLDWEPQQARLHKNEAKPLHAEKDLRPGGVQHILPISDAEGRCLLAWLQQAEAGLSKWVALWSLASYAGKKCELHINHSGETFLQFLQSLKRSSRLLNLSVAAAEEE